MVPTATNIATNLVRLIYRMPVILHPEDYELWLDGDARKLDLVKETLRPYPAGEMLGYPVGTLVNNPRSQGEELIERALINSA